MGGRAIWITGLPGSGKSTVADGLKEALPYFVVLRMDELRTVVTPHPDYSGSEREIVYRALVYLAKKLTDLGHDVIIDATGNLRKWRDLARDLIPRYTEVYLKCKTETCMKRESAREETRGAPRDIYRKGADGWPVPGMSAPYEEPLRPEIVIDTDEASAGNAAALIEDFLKKHRKKAVTTESTEGRSRITRRNA
jgi:adenylylsulfate kinase